MKNAQTFAQFLKVKDFPFEIKDKNGKLIYLETSNGYWFKSEYDDKGNPIRFENSYGYWSKSEYDEQGKEIRFENSIGEIIDKRSKPMIELTLEDITKMKGVDVSQIRIKE
jgi:hypothetical protein